VQAELRRSGYEDLIAAGIVLTGGSSKIEGAVDLAEEIFHVPVRLATPYGITGLTEMVKNPIYATGVGLLLYGQKQHETGAVSERVYHEVETSVMDRLKHWVKGNF
ncbi:MAG: cell division protein FtsA, partial [Pseudomonadales bacterium]|nr:cell division protein FtsA [Pseudomonadales bacterium]